MAAKKDYGFVPDKHGFVPDAPGEESNKLQDIARSGWSKFLAPMAGGMAGAGGGMAAGAALGALGGPAAPITVPAGAMIGGMLGAGVGTAGAEAGREAVAGEQINPQEILKQGGIAAATEPLGMILGPGIAGVKALKGAGSIALAGKKFLGGATKEIEARFPGAIEKLGQVAVGNRGVRQLDKMLTPAVQQHKALVHAASVAGAKTNPVAIMQPVIDIINQLDEAGSPMADAVRNRAYKFFKALGNGAEIPATRVLKVKQVAQDATDRLYRDQSVRRAAGKATKRVGGKTAELNFQEALARGSRQWLETNVPGSAELNQEIHSLMGAKEAMLSTASRNARRGVARMATAGTTVALPGGLGHHLGAGALGYHLGQHLEPLTTPMMGAGLDALQNPATQTLLSQLPRAAGLGFNQAMRDQP